MSFFLSVAGVVLIFEGIPWFLSPVKTKIMLVRVCRMPDSSLRFLGLSAMLVGLLLVRLGL